MSTSVAIARLDRPSAMPAEHGELALAQAVERTAPAPALEHLGDDLGVERRAAARDLRDGVRELARLGDAVLEQVADARGALPSSWSA